MFKPTCWSAGLAGLAATAMIASSAALAEVKIRVQSVIPSKADEVHMLNEFAKDVNDLTNGEVVIEVLPAGAVVGVKETLDAVDAGLVEGGFAWTHYWSGKHPAAMLFGSPVAGAGVGIDNIAFMSWFLYGGGKELYDQLWKEMGVNVKGFMLQPVGPEALGWFKEPINSMEDFRKYRFRTPPGIPGQTYNDIGVAAVAMGGGDILPALEKGTHRRGPSGAAPSPTACSASRRCSSTTTCRACTRSWSTPTSTSTATSTTRSPSTRRRPSRWRRTLRSPRRWPTASTRTAKALKDLTENHGVQLHDTPTDYFSEYMNAAKASLEKNAEANAFFKGGVGVAAGVCRDRGAVLGRGADLQRQPRPGVRQVASVRRKRSWQCNAGRHVAEHRLRHILHIRRHACMRACSPSRRCGCSEDLVRDIALERLG